MKNLLYGLLTITLLSLSTLSYSNDDRGMTVDLILPNNNEILDRLSKKIDSSEKYTVNTYINSLPDDNKQGDILVIVSEKLIPLLNEKNYKARFALYVNSKNYQKLELIKSSALFSDQPLSRQLSLIQAIFGNEVKKIGVAYKDERYENEISELTKITESLTINKTKIVEKNIIRSINKLIQSNDILIATSENDIFNSKTIRPILLSSYRHQTVIIGPTEGFVIAGALGTILSSPSQYADDLIAMINNYIDSNKLPPSQYPSKFKVKINYSVAESLGLIIDNEETLENIILNQGDNK
ncbi:Uncharacterised protein [Zhongshania aliphaticivorans]|uniref:ABC transporter substrate-binding protein n=1 Tax=Zhongshania aliphaticivorans TaxID=1470434 RepID=A0A5S9PKC6_9GAMM|nr:hypothetical protein [Zhongshania aliphaticivorans]CAA0104370.1 Uncharacterised protein [Zhongshania aliphaticivorans]CAA0104610.1 Uncharacterised protein [Zhongshania aliphaticivorans]